MSVIVWVHNGERNSHVTSEPAEVIVGVLTFNPTVEVLEVYLCSLDTQKDTYKINKSADKNTQI